MASDSAYVEIVVKGHADPGTETAIKKAYNVYVYKRAATTPALNKANVATAFKTAVIDVLKDLLSVSYKADSIDIRALDDHLDPYLPVAHTADGTVAGDSLPSTNNVVMHMKTSVRGRAYRGRKHFSPIAEADTTLDNLKATPIANWASFGAAYLAGFTDSDGSVWVPHVVQYSLSAFTPLGNVVVSTPVSSVTVNATLGTMKRRKQPNAS